MEKIIRKKMESRGVSREAVQSFLDMVRRIDNEKYGYVSLKDLSLPEDDLIIDSNLSPEVFSYLDNLGKRLISRVAVVKLNGGRSTTMGGLVPKGTIQAKNGRCYLDIIMGQINAMRKMWHTQVPLVLMNSFFTHDSTVKFLKHFDGCPITFVQNQVPRLLESTLEPLDTGTDDDWAPPGHGDIYRSLLETGLIDQLLNNNFKYIFVSNVDNLAATLEPWILGLIHEQGIDFLLEVTDRTPLDRKGGTLVLKNGRLDLLEIAQVAPDEKEQFMDIERFRVFNTNNLWVDLESLTEALKNQSLVLPLIQNHKKIRGKRIVQLETAMGAAIGCFSKARGLRVGRNRFFPTKTISDLFVLQSDACILDLMDRVKKNPSRPSSLPDRPIVKFHSDFLDKTHHLSDRFEEPSSVSVLHAHTLEVAGSVYFESDIRVEGHVALRPDHGQHYVVKRGSTLRDEAYPLRSDERKN